MPELPDVTVYLERLEPRVIGRPIEDVRIRSAFLVRTFDPPVVDAVGKVVRELRRLGKRIVLGLEGDLFLVFHLMIAGRFRWRERGAKIHRTQGLCALDFETGTLMMTEASKKKRASLHVVRGEEALAGHQPGGLEPLGADFAGFADALRRENRTLKRALTDPRLFSGIGNAYSDEILHAARLSPAQRTGNLDDEEIDRLRAATEGTLTRWIERTRAEVGDGFPDKVTAFRDGMAVHGRYGEPCPVCGDPVQRIVYAENESNYCATCQTGGKLLADRALSRLFRGDWPRSLEELENAKNPES